MTRIEKRLLILWFALAFVVWNGVYDMRMHDTVRGYLWRPLAQAGLGRGVDMRDVPRTAASSTRSLSRPPGRPVSSSPASSPCGLSPTRIKISRWHGSSTSELSPYR